MGLFGKKKGKNCALCGKKLIDTDPTYGIMAPGRNLDFTEVVGRVSLKMHQRAYVCEKCGASVCTGCLPLSDSPSHWKNFPKCPKCGSDMERL